MLWIVCSVTRSGTISLSFCGSLRIGTASASRSTACVVAPCLVAGWLAGLIIQGTGFGLIGDLVIGIIGAFIGDWMLPRLGIHLGFGLINAIINATIGAIVLLVIIRVVRGSRRW